MSQNGTEDHFFHVFLVILEVSTVDQTYNTEASGTPPLKHTRGTPILWIFRASHPRSLEPQEGAPPPAPGLGMSEFRSLTEQVPRELNSLHARALPAQAQAGGLRELHLSIGMTLEGPIYTISTILETPTDLWLRDVL